MQANFSNPQLISANYISMSEIVLGIERNYEFLRNEFNEYQGPIPNFTSRFGGHKSEINLNEFYYEFIIQNSFRTWTLSN